jgi:hypothetical protein
VLEARDDLDVVGHGQPFFPSALTVLLFMAYLFCSNPTRLFAL